MPRKKAVVLGQQVYKLPGYGPHAQVTIDYDVTNAPPFFQPAAGIVIVGDHVCLVNSGLGAGATTQPIPGPDAGPSLAEIREFQRKREEPVKRKPLTSEDIAREQGFNPQALSFETLSGIAEQMGPVAASEDSVVE